MFAKIINMIFPPKCIFCKSVLNSVNSMEVCEGCFEKISFIDKHITNLSTGSGSEFFCDGVICLCSYTGIVRDSLIRYKFENKPGYCRVYAKLLSEKVKKVTNTSDFDIIISVPLYHKKQHTRGYNQSKLISKILSKEINVPDKSHLLVRDRHTDSQSLLKKEQRFENIREAFRVYNPTSINGKSILLVDDIITTGATIEECSKVLKNAGSSKVLAAVVASGRKF